MCGKGNNRRKARKLEDQGAAGTERAGAESSRVWLKVGGTQVRAEALDGCFGQRLAFVLSIHGNNWASLKSFTLHAVRVGWGGKVCLSYTLPPLRAPKKGLKDRSRCCSRTISPRKRFICDTLCPRGNCRINPISRPWSPQATPGGNWWVSTLAGWWWAGMTQPLQGRKPQVPPAEACQ